MSEQTLVFTFTELRRGFLRLASHFLPNEDDANDAIQDAFCRLWPRRDEINTKEEAEALTVTTVKNLCIDALRKKHIDTVEIEEWRDAEITEAADEIIEREERFRQVKSIIDIELSPLQRDIFYKKEFEDMSVDNISKELDMQPTAVRMQLSRARKTIRECYKNQNSYDTEY